jgi:putative endonuclease
MYQRHETGKIGEELATKYLLEKGYKIIDRNFSCKQGEIDIIALDKDYYVFVEVKTRTNEHYGKPREAVDEKKKKHIYLSAQYYVNLKHIENRPIRIDIIEVYKRKNKYYLNHIKNAVLDKPKKFLATR